MNDRIDELEATIKQLLSERAEGSTICPSEAARAIDSIHWQPLMESARQAARNLVAQGRIEITQGGQVVDPDSIKGPIRLRRRRGGG